MDCDVLYKVVVIGDSGVGKSNLITRYTRDQFSKDSKSTIGVEFASKLIDHEGVKIKGQIWDTAGQDRFRAIAAAYYRGAHGALIVYDITNPTSFQNLDSWFKEIENQGEKNCINIIVGNKCDLEEQRQVDTEEGKRYAAKHNIRFLETSAAESTNVDLVFTSLLHDIYNSQKSKMKAHPDDEDGDDVPIPDPSTRGGIRIGEHVEPKKNDNCGC